jgi:hypothetical protein
MDSLPRQRPDLPTPPVVLGVGVAQRYLVLVGMAHCSESGASAPSFCFFSQKTKKTAFYYLTLL